MKPPQQLRDEVDLLRSVYQRNRNQHRNQVWWKYFSVFLRRVSQLSKSSRLDAATVNFLDTKLIPRLWRALHTALAQGAFLSITFTVMAGVARVAELIQPAVPRKPTLQLKMKSKHSEEEDIGEEISQVYPIEADYRVHDSKSSGVVGNHRLDEGYGEDQRKSIKHSGEKKITSKAAQVDAIDDIFRTPTGFAREKDRKKPKKSSKKKKLDAIDAIFG